MLDIRDGWDVPLEWLTGQQAVAQPPRGAVLKVLLKYARADRARLFALVDCARDDEALRLLAHDEAPWRSLFAGGPLESSLVAAPVLVHCRGASRLISWLTEQAWGQQQAIFLLSRLSLEELAPALGASIRLRDQFGVSSLFRFYDPRVLRTYLASCTPAEIERFFAGLTRVICETERGGVLVFDHGSYPSCPLQQLEPPAEPGRFVEASEATMAALEAYGLRLFHEQTIALLRRDHAEAVADSSDEALVARIDEAVERARRSQIVLEADVQRYVVLTVRLGPRFDEEPRYGELRAILEATALSAAQKLDNIDAALEAAD